MFSFVQVQHSQTRVHQTVQEKDIDIRKENKDETCLSNAYTNALFHCILCHMKNTISQGS